MPAIAEESMDQTKCNFRTPVINRALHYLQPRTPTPFKNHLASLEKKSGVVKLEVCHRALEGGVETYPNYVKLRLVSVRS